MPLAQLQTWKLTNLKVLTEALDRQCVAVEEALYSVPGDDAERNPCVVRMRAGVQIIECMCSAIVTSVERSVAACIGSAREPLRDAFQRLIQRHTASIWVGYQRRHGRPPTEYKKQKGPSLVDFDNYLKDQYGLDVDEKGLASRLNPTCDSVDTGVRFPGAMPVKKLLDILTALGEPADLDRLRQIQIDPDLHNRLHKLTTAVNGMLTPPLSESDQVPLLPITYRGRYNMADYKDLLQLDSFSKPSVTIPLCEAERLFLVHLLQATKPVHPTHCAALHQLAGRLSGPWPLLTAMPNLDADLFDRWCRVWRQVDQTGLEDFMANPDRPIEPTPPVRMPTLSDKEYDIASYVPTPALPVPPIGCMVILEQWLGASHQRIISQSDAQRVIEALFAQGKPFGIELNISQDEAAVLSEALVNRTLQPPVTLPEMVMVSCLLAKVGLPWLPPAAPPVPLHIPYFAATLILGNAGLFHGAEDRDHSPTG